MKFLHPVFDCDTILKKYDIEITPVRKAVLRTIQQLAPSAFTIQQVYEAMLQAGLEPKRNTVEYTLRLYKARRIVIEGVGEAPMRRGRVEMKLLYVLMHNAPSVGQ